jgi:hypothetical protein
MRVKPDISENFTIEDIHKIREYNYYRRMEIGRDAYNKEIRERVDNILKDYPNIRRVKPSNPVKKPDTES